MKNSGQLWCCDWCVEYCETSWMIQLIYSRIYQCLNYPNALKINCNETQLQNDISKHYKNDGTGKKRIWNIKIVQKIAIFSCLPFSVFGKAYSAGPITAESAVACLLLLIIKPISLILSFYSSQQHHHECNNNLFLSNPMRVLTEHLFSVLQGTFPLWLLINTLHSTA